MTKQERDQWEEIYNNCQKSIIVAKNCLKTQREYLIHLESRCALAKRTLEEADKDESVG
ncbi:hypothetical protein PVA44_07500 (plasmid) [Entomospira nematocerorum]|uniref:Uncharacterized protein n=1 Tax=Entomospira nematocerorum TaxID=2719987 RepID=A0A968GH46_9SPIO|nr:hypothetical protein [Entomospira nematocera]NIZ47756.1 hypothetical protein [Entomospira nematocera]WDI34710.1 hypothetical protein PVA44_07500 [Entomospira nematocera]